MRKRSVLNNGIHFISITSMLLCCTPSTNSNPKKDDKGVISESGRQPTSDTLSHDKLFTLSDAEKILGEPSQLLYSNSKVAGEDVTFIDSMSTFKKEASSYSCGYKATSEDKKSGKTGNVYFMVEQYPQVSKAQRVYSYYKTANEKSGIENLQNLGDEAYFHTDNENFYFVMVRKGSVVYNIKVNKITSNTSLKEFNLTAEKIVNML